jgi:hypothetical protein
MTGAVNLPGLADLEGLKTTYCKNTEKSHYCGKNVHVMA